MGRKRKRTPEKVEILYAKGLRRYMIVNGMISWGFASGLVFLVIQSLWLNGFSYNGLKNHVTAYESLLWLALFMAAGLVWGRFTWPVIEKQVERIKGGKTAPRRDKKQ